MHAATTQQRLETVGRLCGERGLRVTRQRCVTLEAVLEIAGRSTAEGAHEAVLPRLPAVSRTTVYRAPGNLVRIRAVTKACRARHSARYDRRVERHDHLICLHCDAIVDISDERLDALPLPDTSAYGFEVESFAVELRGTCRRCRDQHRREVPP